MTKCNIEDNFEYVECHVSSRYSMLFTVWSENNGIFRHSVIHAGINSISLKRLTL